MNTRRNVCFKAAVALTLVLLGAAPSFAEIIPAPGPGDRRIRTAFYSADQVYRIVGYAGFYVSLEFAKDETFRGIEGGDLDAIIYSSDENSFTLKPHAPSVDMNLIVRTNKRRYYISYSASTTSPDAADTPVMYVVRFAYPPEPSPALAPPTADERLDAAIADTQALKPRNYDYWYCGNPAIKPLSASDDGVHTRLRFAPQVELPAIFVRGADGSESLLNFSVHDGEVIVHRVVERLILRRGRLTGCIVNRAFAGGAERMQSGTLSPQVKRERKVVPP